MNDDKPFVCPVADCSMRFINEDHLNVHSKKHEMSLALNSGGLSSSSPAHHFLDQTPTPTKFLKNCGEEISLFQELTQNPFDHAYKKALDNDPPLPGPQTGELNTPTLILSDYLKSSGNMTATTFLLGVEKAKGSEPLKPSPLAKTTVVSKLMLDLSGKSVMAAQPSSSAGRRSMSSQDADRTSSLSAVMSQVMAATTTTSQAMRTVSSSHLASQHEASQHSTSRLAGVQQHISTSSPVADGEMQLIETIKQEVMQREEATGATDSGENFQEHQQECTMQVLLQLPNGDTVPISIPATINKWQYLGGGSAQPTQNPPLQKQIAIQHQPPPLQPAPSKTVAPSISTTLALKQRLKAQLQSQLSPTTKSSELSMTMSNPTVTATPSSISGPALIGSTSPIMMVDSPGSEMNLSDSSDYSFDGKRQKMSPETGNPEDRRLKFLERNRAAAARCRQKRKHWISNLERKADELQSTNVRLQSEVKLLRGEVAQLKTLLLAHKDCPVTEQQRSQGQLQHIMLTDSNLTSQELAQVVPTSEATTEALQIGQTIVTFLRESIISHPDDLEMSSE